MGQALHTRGGKVGRQQGWFRPAAKYWYGRGRGSGVWLPGCGVARLGSHMTQVCSFNPHRPTQPAAAPAGCDGLPALSRGCQWHHIAPHRWDGPRTCLCTGAGRANKQHREGEQQGAAQRHAAGWHAGLSAAQRHGRNVKILCWGGSWKLETGWETGWAGSRGPEAAERGMASGVYQRSVQHTWGGWCRLDRRSLAVCLRFWWVLGRNI